MYLDFDCLFKTVLNCNNDKNSVLYSGSCHFRTSVKDFPATLKTNEDKGVTKGLLV